MNADTNDRRARRGDSERPQAVQRAETGAEAWCEVVRAQLAAIPDHADFYALAGEMVETLRVLDSLAGVMARQVMSYGTGRAVYDDAGSDPAHRLRSAVLALAEVRDGLARAERAANQFWSAIGHVGVGADSA
ncbi:MAG: hypothetical protein J0I49_20725 [Pseudonocardia sp.]|uniref:hypothetical protein n=1 Tax=Pseudonocardia sp. TaxID=60912 RepID=UPI001AD2FD67|nr:hypothetical protein [Pseudonocardia sp.]MBN9100517.1 hypothetical protein [Pseudonocardia sp.]